VFRHTVRSPECRTSCATARGSFAKIGLLRSLAPGDERWPESASTSTPS
jgi:hypothetical protein